MILKSELAYLRGRLLVALIASSLPLIAVIVFAVIDGGFQQVSHITYAMLYVIGHIIFGAIAYNAVHEAPEPRVRRFPMLMMVPNRGSRIFWEVVISRVILLMPTIVASLLLGLMGPAIAHRFTLYFTTGFFSFALLVLGLLYLHMGFWSANSKQVQIAIIVWDLVLVGAIVVPIVLSFLDGGGTAATVPQPVGIEAKLNRLTGNLETGELFSWAKAIVTFALCHWTYSRRQSYLGV